MRQIILDTETTGIGPERGHRIIEIGCVELVDRQFTNNNFHAYINPERSIDDGAFKVHGISESFLSDKPKFNEIIEEFIAYIKEAELIIHNAAFDVGFLNSELKHCKRKISIESCCEVVDTLALAREKHPGQKNNLDALCKRYDIDNSNRQLHGALLDAQILGQVYLAMTGGQISLLDSIAEPQEKAAPNDNSVTIEYADGKIIHPDCHERSAHQGIVKMIIEKSGLNRFDEIEG